MAVRELIRADISVLNQGSRNGQDGISMLQTMEAAMAVMDENLVRMKELAEQAATGSYSSAQRAIMDAEFAEMADEIERVSNATKFNNIAMLNETALTSGANDVKIHVGTTTTIDVEKVNMTKAGLNIDTGDGGWEVTSATAYGATSTSTSWLTVLDGSAVADDTSVTLAIQFLDSDGSSTSTYDESAITVIFTAGKITSGGVTTAAQTYSLANVVSQINNASMALGWDSSGNDLRYSAAEAVYDSTSSKYVLKVSSRGSVATQVAVTWSGIGTNAAAASNGFVSGGFLACTNTKFTGTDLQSACLRMGDSGATQAGLNIQTVDAAVTALTRIESAINTKDTARASFGYKMNRLESTVSILEIQAENLQAAESRISDVDVATEMARLTSTQVLSQAGVQMLAQANSIPQMALTLLRG
jgi:flagellin